MTAWRTWLVTDQRFVDGRPDVLTYETEPLTKPVTLSRRRPSSTSIASTSGTDQRLGRKAHRRLPGTRSRNPPMGGYELPIAMDIFRGRYRTSFEHPQAITPDKPLLYQYSACRW